MKENDFLRLNFGKTLHFRMKLCNKIAETDSELIYGYTRHQGIFAYFEARQETERYVRQNMRQDTVQGRDKGWKRMGGDIGRNMKREEQMIRPKMGHMR